MTITLKEIARQVGVSQPLVSYALNGKPGVSDAMRQKILKAAAEMGYNAHANRAAKVLIAKRHGVRVRTGVLALLMPPFVEGPVSVQDNPFFLPYFCGVEIEAARRDFHLFVCAMRGEELPTLVKSGDVDGVIGVGIARAFSALRDLGLPFVALGFQENNVRSLVPDDEAGIRQIVEHLVQNGHTRIAYLGLNPNAAQPARERLQAFKLAMKEHGLIVDKELIETGTFQVEREVGAQLLQKILCRSTDFSALVCYNDLMAMGAVNHLQSLKRKVPRDISVAGFDGYASQIGFRPLLTSASFDRQAMGRRAVAMLCESIGDENVMQSLATELFPTHLEIGETA